MRISLTALRAFEATARLSSMSMAAIELRVGLASISRHVSALQARLGVELLRREGRRVVLTPAGRAYFADITAAFRSINSATDSIAAEGGPRGPKLTIACDRSLAQRWLLPRLPAFWGATPALSLAVLDASDVSNAGVTPDISIVFRSTHQDVAPDEIVLCEPPMLAIASATLPGSLNSLQGLLRTASLVHARSRDQWRDWLALAGHRGETPRGGVVMPDKAMAIDAANEGMGVALGCHVLAGEELASGSCRVLLGEGHVLGRYLAIRAQRPVVDPGLSGSFIDWLREEMLASAQKTSSSIMQPA